MVSVSDDCEYRERLLGGKTKTASCIAGDVAMHEADGGGVNKLRSNFIGAQRLGI